MEQPPTIPIKVVERWPTRGNLHATWHSVGFFLNAMKVDKLKVRPKKMAANAPCAAEFAAVLACWASSNDIRSQSVCLEPTRTLRECMATKRATVNKSKPTINYHLARFSKRV
ncbi:hypothetical protein GLX27_000264 [Malassezia furfur]|uniref:37S ribosomal protein mrp10, mitochondrial n=1 Tax=Malassezia furfur TaxID=55194 RepID=A0ABY8EIP4_MALFU|nr:hypothetical protein GLX27_000264 [Malassezia furfur]